MDVIQRLKYYGSKVFDTQDNGELTINLDEEVYIVYRDNLNQKSLAREVYRKSDIIHEYDI